MTEVELKPGERLDDLQAAGFRLIQRPGTFCLGTDSVLLAHFCAPRRRERIVNLGCGNGAIALLLAAHRPDCCVDGVELQAEMADMARRSVALNGLQHVVSIHRQDLRRVREFLPHAAYQLVICNPPYSPERAAIPSPDAALRGARHETLCTLEDIAAAAEWLLRSRARLCLMLPVARLTDATATLRRHRLELKRLRFVHGNAARPARLVLMEAMLDVHAGVIVEPPLIVHQPDGTDTDEIRRIYHLPPRAQEKSAAT